MNWLLVLLTLPQYFVFIDPFNFPKIQTYLKQETKKSSGSYPTVTNSFVLWKQKIKMLQFTICIEPEFRDKVLSRFSLWASIPNVTFYLDFSYLRSNRQFVEKRLQRNE